MTSATAAANIGQSFKVKVFTSGQLARFDSICKVENGFIHGDFIEACALDCRLKNDIPLQLKNIKK